MAEASGLYKRVKYKKETTFGVLPTAAAARSLRRIASDLSLTKDSYRSNEKRPDMQVKDFRHGVRRVAGKFSADLSAATFSDFLGSFCKRLFTAGVASTGLTITIAGTGPAYTLTRSAGDFIADGWKLGMVGRLGGAGFNAANTAKNLWVTGLTAASATVVVLNGSSLVTEGPIASASFTAAGKATWVAASGQVEESYAIEHFFPETPASETFTGVKINGFTLNLPPTGIATLDVDLVGKDLVASASEYFTSPNAATTTGSMAAVNGLLRMSGGISTVLTGLTITGVANYTGDPVAGSNTIPKMFPGIVEVTGQATAYFDTVTLRDAFLNETELEIAAAFTADNSANSQFMAFVMPRCKLMSHTKSDSDGAIVATIAFQALFNSAGGSGQNTEQTTLLIQDSDAF